MKAALLLIMIAMAFATSDLFLPNEDQNVVRQWKDFLAKYKKNYANGNEHETRFQIFKKNLDLIKWIQSGDEGAVYGVTQFADLTTEEFEGQFLTLKTSELPKADEITNVEVGDLPDEWDWRKYNAVTPVKNQGQCGSCWAFSSAGNLEGQLQLVHGKLVNISTQQMVDCDKVDQGCGGGLMEDAFKYITQAGGIESNEDYPYEGQDGKCRFDAAKVVLKVTGQTFFSKDEKEIAAALVKTGPLAVALNASWLQFYVFGVSDPVICSPKNLNHGVLLIGYGNDKKDFWTVKNSWGNSWGEKGFFRMVRGKGKCGINTYVITAQIA